MRCQEEELTNNEIERERCYQNLLTELALEIRIEITWSIVNGYQNEPPNSNNTKSELQLTNLDEAYLVDIPQWGETPEGLEFEGSSDNRYKDTGYGYYNLHLDSNNCWWNTNKDKKLFPEFTANLESSEWLSEFDDNINWDYNDSYKTKKVYKPIMTSTNLLTKVGRLRTLDFSKMISIPKLVTLGRNWPEID
ncbi:21702_t:CDS:2 [Dentiscutata erythropus]|uniref:21702_t:CDS:1 n=1 Tax=Dentiscutata erythropus TaxID=1348616 RepID=A0A9N8VH33_9GLOM|nr:21702_t:CDS:2 [Dentiscutata erythropus]